MRIDKQGVIITGGGSGMGAATARWLAKLGARVAILDRDSSKAQSIAAEISGLALACDVTNSDEITIALKEAEEKHGIARICINCAGIAPAKRLVGKQGAMPLEEFSRVINTNLIGTFNVMRLAAEAMSAADPVDNDGQRGVIINTASIAAYEGQIGQVAYSASKAAIVGLTLPAARDLANFGIRVMTIAPGIMATPMLQGMPDEVQQSLAATVNFPKRLGSPEEFAHLVEHIILNDYLNGEVIRLDGALRLRDK